MIVVHILQFVFYCLIKPSHKAPLRIMRREVGSCWARLSLFKQASNCVSTKKKEVMKAPVIDCHRQIDALLEPVFHSWDQSRP